MAQFQSTSVTGSLTVTGQVIAQTLNVQQVTSSIVYSSGSNVFGNSLSNTQQFTGSVSVTGSLTVNGAGTFSSTLTLNGSNNVIRSGNELRFNRVDNAIYTRLYDAGSLAANGFILDNTNGEGFHFQNNGSTIMRMNSSNNVGIGTTNPSATLDIGSGKNLSGTDPISVYTDVRVASAVTGGLIGYNLRMVALAGSYTVANMYGIKTNTAVVQSGVTVTNSYGIYIGRTDDPTSGGIVTNKYALVTEATAGNVGIGTTTPLKKLDVYESSTASVAQYIRNTTINGLLLINGTSEFQVGTETNHPFTIITNNQERLRVTANGLSFNGDTAAANALDDYEEGTWTPVIRGSGTAGTYELSTPTYSTYTKIGRQVTVAAQITLQGSITGGGTGYLQITGLPFTKANNTVFTGAAQLNGIDFTGQYVSVKFVTVSPSTVIYLAETVDNGGSIDLPISAISAGDGMSFTLTYFE